MRKDKNGYSDMDTIKRKSLLYKSQVEYADYSLNHVLGCSHGCKYPCYAFMLKKRAGQVASYDDWRRPRLVENAAELVRKEIVKLSGKITNVELCFSTDPFMYGQSEIHSVTAELVEIINEADVPCHILTKGVYPEDFPGEHAHKDNEYGISLVSLDEHFKELYEPYAAPYQDRIDSLKRIHGKGMKTWVSIEPYPTPNIITQDLEKILKSVSFVDRVIFGRLNYNKLVSEYGDQKDFYRKLAEQVVDHCKRTGKGYFIKKGTA